MPRSKELSAAIDLLEKCEQNGLPFLIVVSEPPDVVHMVSNVDEKWTKTLVDAARSRLEN